MQKLLSFGHIIRLIKIIFFILSLIVLGYMFYEFSRLGGLPDHTKAGRYNDFSITYGLMAILTLSFSFKRLGKYIFSVVLFLAVLITISNWWYFSFYRDYLSFESFRLFFYFKESVQNIPGLPFKKEALLSFLAFVLYSFFLFKLKSFRPPNKILVGISLCFVALSTVSYGKFSKFELGGGLHNALHPIAFLGYDLALKNKMENIDITSSHTDSLKKLFPQKSIAKLSKEFPLMQSVEYDKATSKQKNVLIVVMESLRAAEMGVYGAAKSVTPNLDKISKESSVLFENAYANSFQTSRGELAILCSAYDYVRGSPYSESNNVYLTKCLPELLKENGYSTFWFHGYDKSFFNRNHFLPNVGIEHLHDKQTLKDNGFDKELGWGTPDGDVLDYTLSVLEKQEAPFFAEVLTVSNHFPYKWEWDIDFPPELEITEVNENKGYHAYKRGMYYTDKAIGAFWEKFKKSPLYDETIVVFTADHGIWLYDEGLDSQSSNQSFFEKKDKYFRIPLIVHSPDIQSSVNKSPVSQIDIAPTVLGMLNISSVNAFAGKDMFNDATSNEPWVLSMGNGGVSFRQGDMYCHPDIKNSNKECKSDKVYQSCNAKSQSQRQYICGNVEGNFLYDDQPSISFTSTPSVFSDIEQLMEYSEYSLKKGLMPNSNK